MLPFAYLPSPAQNACSPTSPTLTWARARCAGAHLVYFGENENELQFIAAQDSTSLLLENLKANTEYFWQVNEVTSEDTVIGIIWQFRTEKTGELSPNPGYTPFPADSSDYHTKLVRLSWKFDQCTIDSSYIYFGSSPTNLKFEGIEKYGTFFKSGLDDDSTYYWRVDTKNEYGVATGPVWSFTLNPTITASTTYPIAKFQVKSFPNPSNGIVNIAFAVPHSGQVTFQFHDNHGKLMETISKRIVQPGSHLLLKYLSGHQIQYCTMTFDGQKKTIPIILR